MNLTIAIKYKRRHHVRCCKLEDYHSVDCLDFLLDDPLVQGHEGLLVRLGQHPLTKLKSLRESNVTFLRILESYHWHGQMQFVA